MDVQAIDLNATAGSAALPQLPPGFHLPTGFPSADAAQHDETLHAALSQVFGADVAVQFKVVPGTGDIITVFTDKSTGRVITQFPPEAMVLIAQFFNKLAGAVVDRKA